MNPFKAVYARLRDEGLAGLLPTKNRTVLGGPPSQRPSVRQPRQESTMRNEFGVEVPVSEEYGVQPSEPWPRNDGPPEGYENPIESRRATSTLGIPYPGDIETSINPNEPGLIQTETYRQAAIEHYTEEGRSPAEAGRLAAQRLQERFGTLAELQHRAIEATERAPMPMHDPEYDPTDGPYEEEYREASQVMRSAYAGLSATRVNLNDYSGLSLSATREHPPLYQNPMNTRQNLVTREHMSVNHMGQEIRVPGRLTQGDPMAITNFIGGSSFQSSNSLSPPLCHDCTYVENTNPNWMCNHCNRSESNRGAESRSDVPIIDRFITTENKDYLYNEWKEKATKRIKKEARQEILDEMKNEKKIFKRNKLGGIIKYSSAPDMRHKC